MESAKPIEEGCRALIIKSKCGNEWKEVDVVKYLGKVPMFGGDDRWELKQQIKTRSGYATNTHRGSWMVRIDDDDIQKQIEAEQEKVIVRV